MLIYSRQHVLDCGHYSCKNHTFGDLSDFGSESALPHFRAWGSNLEMQKLAADAKVSLQVNELIRALRAPIGFQLDTSADTRA